MLAKGEMTVSSELLSVGLVALGLLIYLLYTLVFPERF